MRAIVVCLALGCAAEPPPTPAPVPTPPAAPAARLYEWQAVDADGAAPVVERRFRQAIVSWDADTPAGASIEVDLRARIAGTWTHDYVMGVWSSDPAFHSHSVAGQDDAQASVDTDTFLAKTDADAFQARVKSNGGARLRSLAVVVTHPDDRMPAIAARPTAAIDVPTRSQMLYPNGGEVWCSPTSTSMILAYYGYDETVPAAAQACYDSVYAGTGNWPFNTAHAAAVSQGKLRAVVTRLYGIDQLQQLVGAGYPVVTSCAWAAGGLPGAPVGSTDGHLIVVRGFDDHGDVLVNDPAGPNNDSVRYTYARASFDAAWAHSGRTIYLIHPVDRTPPREYAFGSW